MNVAFSRRYFLSSVARLAVAMPARGLESSKQLPLPSSGVFGLSHRYVNPRKVLLWESTRKEIREALTIQEGDTVIFQVEGNHAILKPFKKKSLADFCGVLPATRPYPGVEAIRKEFHHKMGKRFHRKGVL